MSKRVLYIILPSIVLFVSFQNCDPSFKNNPFSKNISATNSTANSSSTTNAGLTQSPCDDGWALVPGNGDYQTTDFCVMKFEAQNNNSLPVSQFSTPGSDLHLPWQYATQIQARQACSSIGAHLVNMNEAQTISQNLLLVAQNWDTGVVGQGCMFGGHNDLDPLDPLPAPSGSDQTANPYFYTNDHATKSPEANNGQCFTVSKWIGDTTNPTLETHSNGWLSRRTLVLSNGQLIWDWTGNISEWIEETCQNSGTFPTEGLGVGFFDYNPADHPNSTDPIRTAPLYTEWTRYYLQDYESLVFGPRNPKVPGTELLNSNNGVGMYFGCKINGNAIYRGGAAYHGAEGGVFQTHMDHSVSFDHPYIGFRCAKSPR